MIGTCRICQEIIIGREVNPVAGHPRQVQEIELLKQAAAEHLQTRHRNMFVTIQNACETMFRHMAGNSLLNTPEHFQSGQRTVAAVLVKLIRNEDDPPAGPPEQVRQVRVVYRPKTAEEGRRRWARMEKMKGTPFEHLPRQPTERSILDRASDGTEITVDMVEMVFNDAVLMDAVSDYGTDGPLYRDTIEGIHREVYDLAVRLYGRDPAKRPDPV